MGIIVSILGLLGVLGILLFIVILLTLEDEMNDDYSGYAESGKKELTCEQT